MIDITTISINVNIEKPVKPAEDVLLFTGDAVSIKYNLQHNDGSGAEVTGISGTLYGIRADGQTVTAEATVTDSAVIVHLGDADGFFAIPGRLKLALRVTAYGDRRVVWAGVANVVATNSDTIAVVSGMTIAELEEFVRRITNLRPTQVLGYYSTLANLRTAKPNPLPGDIYGVGTAAPYNYYQWDGTTGDWIGLGNIMFQSPSARCVYQNDNGLAANRSFVVDLSSFSGAEVFRVVAIWNGIGSAATTQVCGSGDLILGAHTTFVVNGAYTTSAHAAQYFEMLRFATELDGSTLTVTYTGSVYTQHTGGSAHSAVSSNTAKLKRLYLIPAHLDEIVATGVSTAAMMSILDEE